MRLTWNEAHIPEQGLDRAVFYPNSGPGVAWNGFTALKEATVESTNRVRYIDGVKTRSSQTPGQFAGVIEALTYPDVFYDDVLSQRRPRSFGLSYRTGISDHKRIHLVYNVLISSAGNAYQQQDLNRLSWPFTTRPIAIPSARPSAHLILDSSVAYSSTVSDLEEILYGSEAEAPRLPTPQELWDLVEANSILIVTDHGDGTFSITGPDDAITMLSVDTFEVTWPSVILLDPDTYRISSL